MKQVRIPRKIIWIVMAAIVCVPVVAVGTPADGQPKAVVQEREHDFGTAYAGKNIIHSFVIQNQGDAPLELGGVRTG